MCTPNFLFQLLIGIILFLAFCSTVNADNSGQELFSTHCSGCHLNGGNIIRRGKNLKLATLKRNGLDNQDAIAKIAREGIKSMSGYREVLGEKGDEKVAIWILEQAQNAWTHG